MPPREQQSLAERLSRRLGIDGLCEYLTPGEQQALIYDWSFWQRPLEQVGPRDFIGQGTPPGDWIVWLAMTGAGWGKTRLGSEWCIQKAKDFPGCRIAIVGSTQKDAREIMWDGESGINACCPPWWKPHFNVTAQCIEFPNGSLGFLYSAETPEVFRGPQHHFAWGDEPAKWRRLQESYDLLMHRLRLGEHPQMLLTTTPKRVKLLHKLVQDPTTVITRGRTTDNMANLPKGWLAKQLRDYGGTTLGRQELEGELFSDVPGAMWSQTMFDAARITLPVDEPDQVLAALVKHIGVPIKRIVVGVDPATTSHEDSDECGIVVSAVAEIDNVLHGYVLEDATEKLSPEQWGRKVVACVRKWGADCVVAETNLGGETIPAVIRMVDAAAAGIKVIEKGGNRGKKTRAEPIAALYEKGRVHHVGMFARLEDECATFTLDTKKSPNGMDALVYSLGELMLSIEEVGALIV